MTLRTHHVTIEIRSINRHNEVEWTETVEAKGFPAAARKAYRLIRSAGAEEPTQRTRVLNDLERWEI